MKFSNWNKLAILVSELLFLVHVHFNISKQSFKIWGNNNLRHVRHWGDGVQ